MGHKLVELAQLAGVSPRTVRWYVELGLLPAPEKRASATRYDPACLVRLQAIDYLRTKRRLQLGEIKKYFDRIPAEKIEALAKASVTPAQTAATPAQVTTPAPIAEPARPAGAGPFLRWDYVELLPGLELWIRGDAGAVIRRIAEEIHAHYGARAATAPAEPPAGREDEPR